MQQAVRARTGNCGGTHFAGGQHWQDVSSGDFGTLEAMLCERIQLHVVQADAAFAVDNCDGGRNSPAFTHCLLDTFGRLEVLWVRHPCTGMPCFIPCEAMPKIQTVNIRNICGLWLVSGKS